MKNYKLFLFISLFVVTGTSLFAQYSSDDWKQRDRWMNVNKLFTLAGVQPHDAVADLGCHEGYLSMHLAEWVGAQGKVFAVDVKKYRLEKLEKHAHKRGYTNITTVLGAYDNPKLPKTSLDLVFVIDTYHEISSYKKVLSHIYNSLQPGGKVIVLEKIKKHMIGKSRDAQVTAHTLSMNYVKQELQEAGFTIKNELDNFGFWERDKSKQMWILMAVKS